MTLIEWISSVLIALAMILLCTMFYLMFGIIGLISLICFVYFVYRFTKSDRK